MRNKDGQNVNATRRYLLKAGEKAKILGTAIAAPGIRNAEAAETTTWKVRTYWPAGIGLNTFKTWCRQHQGKDRGRTRVQAIRRQGGGRRLRIDRRRQKRGARGDEFFHRYWVGKVPATAFLSSYLMGLRYPHE